VNNREGLIRTFSLLGRFLGQFPGDKPADEEDIRPLNQKFYETFREIVDQEHIHNPWFTAQWVHLALKGLAVMLQKEALSKWLSSYPSLEETPHQPKKVGLVIAGNIPLVGFHDLLCVLASGNHVEAKTSSKDERLIKALAEILSEIDPELGGRIRLTDGKLENVDAVIATGSDNSARYFEYYFRNLPHIIRKNRNGVAVLTGNEGREELEALGWDIFSYFGMGCRNVTKLYLPDHYDLRDLLKVMDDFSDLSQHHKYANNVEYYRSMYLMNKIDFLDNGVLLLKEDKAIASPVGVVFYERYSDIALAGAQISERADQIQCVVSISSDLPGRIPPGSTQEPMPWDYADGVDTVQFLMQLN
jgi:hypothetical protein